MNAVKLRRFLPALFFVLFAGTAGATVTPTARLLISNPAPFVGEETLLTLELRSSPRAGAATPIWPELAPFVSTDLPLPPSRRERSENGEILVQSVQKALRPLTPGTFTLAGAGIRLGEMHLTTTALTLRVRPLSLTGKPPAFSGAVGRIEMALAAGGQGQREIVVTLAGDAPLGDLRPPQAFPGKNERLVLVADTTSGTAPGLRRRELRYLYLPGAGAVGELRFELPCFDPVDERYQTLRVSAAPRRTALYLVFALLAAAGALGALGAFLLRRRPARIAPLERVLTRLLDAEPSALPQRTIVSRLAERGVPPELLAELQEHWQSNERRRFAPAAAERGETDDRRIKRLARRLGKAIDKRPSFP